MREGGHYSSFITTKKPKKIAETSNNEILDELQKFHAVVITIIMKF